MRLKIILMLREIQKEYKGMQTTIDFWWVLSRLFMIREEIRITELSVEGEEKRTDDYEDKSL